MIESQSAVGIQKAKKILWCNNQKKEKWFEFGLDYLDFEEERTFQAGGPREQSFEDGNEHTC